MKRAVCLILLLAAVLSFLCIWQWSHNELKEVSITVRIVSAKDAETQDFEQIRHAVLNRSLLGTLYHPEALTEETQFTFVTFTVRLKNTGLLPAEMVELSLTPFAKDVCAYPATRREIILGPGEEREVSLILLTARQEASARDLIVTSYRWGHLIRQRMTVTRNDYVK